MAVQSTYVIPANQTQKSSALRPRPPYMAQTWQPRPYWLNYPSARGAVAELLGHGDVSTTQRYAHVAPKTVAPFLNEVLSIDIPAKTGTKHE